MENQYFVGNNINVNPVVVVNVESFASLCESTAECTHWTFDNTNERKECWIKTGGKGTAISTSGLVSGPAICPGGGEFGENTIDGYTTLLEKDCNGNKITSWTDGTNALYGIESDLNTCKAICDSHDECAGFVSNGDKCDR
eukprot:UN06678